MKAAGWVAIVSAVAVLPLTAMSVLAGLAQGVLVLTVINTLLSLFSLGLYVYLYISFKKLLNEQCNFHDVDTLILSMIWLNVLVVSLSTVLDFVSLAQPREVISIVILVVILLPIIGLGIVRIMFGAYLLRLDDDLAGMLKPYCYVCIALGACMAFPCLLPVALLVSVASEILLAMIFFRMADSPAVEP